jgi:hypothetical protein
MLTFLCCMALSSYASADGFLAGEYGYGNFTRIIQISMDDIFAAPGVLLDKTGTEFTAINTAALGSTYNEAVFDTWTVNMDASGTGVSMSGSALNTLVWNYNFNTAYASTPFSFEFQALNGDQLVDWATVSYNGGIYADGLNNLDNYTFTSHNSTTVPEPGTALMLLLGIAATGMAAYRRKSLRK